MRKNLILLKKSGFEVSFIFQNKKKVIIFVSKKFVSVRIMKIFSNFLDNNTYCS